MSGRKVPALKVGDRLGLEIVRIDPGGATITYKVNCGLNGLNRGEFWVADSACPPEAFRIEKPALKIGTKIRVLLNSEWSLALVLDLKPDLASDRRFRAITAQEGALIFVHPTKSTWEVIE